MFTEQLPKAQLADVPGGAATSASPTSAGRQRSSCGQADPADLLNSGGLRTPTKIPQIVQMIKEQEAPPPMNASGGVVGDVPGGIPGGHLGAVIGSVISSTSSLAAVPRFVPATPTRIRISGGVTKGLLIHREEPTYPTLARAAGVQGDVVLGLVVGEAFWAQCTYEVVAEYHSPVPPSHSFGLPIWSSNEATLRSNRVTITVGE